MSEIIIKNEEFLSADTKGLTAAFLCRQRSSAIHTFTNACRHPQAKKGTARNGKRALFCRCFLLNIRIAQVRILPKVRRI